jgi:glycosyltransferase involved in cell wall biosynthesis
MTDSDQPPVSIIIPSYNYGKYIVEAIESVLGQSYENIELIIIDDGSVDNSVDVIKSYEGHPRIKMAFHERNMGQGIAFNRALDMARGDYIGFLPADDWYHPNKVEEQIRRFKSIAASFGAVYCDGNRFFEDTGQTVLWKLPVHTGWIAETLIKEGNFIYPITPLFKREVFDKVRFEPGFRAEGEAIYLRIALHYQYDHVPLSLATMRDHSRNTGKATYLMYDENKKWWEWFFDMDDIPAEIRALRKIPLTRNERITGMGLIGDRRDFKTGRKHLRRAMEMSPSLMLNPKIVGAYGVSLLPERIANKVIDWQKRGKALEGS